MDEFERMSDEEISDYDNEVESGEEGEEGEEDKEQMVINPTSVKERIDVCI